QDREAPRGAAGAGRAAVDQPELELPERELERRAQQPLELDRRAARAEPQVVRAAALAPAAPGLEVEHVLAAGPGRRGRRWGRAVHLIRRLATGACSPAAPARSPVRRSTSTARSSAGESIWNARSASSRRPSSSGGVSGAS